MVDSAGKGRGFGFVCYASPGEQEGGVGESGVIHGIHSYSPNNC